MSQQERQSDPPLDRSGHDPPPPPRSQEQSMGILRHRHEVSRRFQMRERMISIGDDYWIEDADGQRAYRVDGKAARVRDTWILEGPGGENLATIRERKL